MATTSPAEMDRVINAHFAAEARHDLDGVLATLTDDAEHDVVGVSPEPLFGRDSIRSFYAKLYALLDQRDVEPVRRYYGEDFLVDEVLYHGIADGSLFGVAGRSGPVSFRMLHLAEFRNGQIARENIWLDVDSIRRQLMAATGGDQ